MKIKALFPCVALVLSACVTEDFSAEEQNKPLITEQQPNQKALPSYIKLKSTATPIRASNIDFVGRLAVMDALRRFLPQYHLAPMDTGVQLEQKVDINAINMPPEQFIQYIAAATALDIQVKGKTLEIRSFLTKEWMLGALTGAKKTNLTSNATLNNGLEKEEQKAALSEELIYDEWESLLEASRDILGVKDAEKGPLKPYVYGTRSVGKVVAGGSVVAMNRLDNYLSGLEAASTQQVTIEVKAYDVKLTDDRGSGVNWQEFSALNASVNGNPLDLGFVNSNGGISPNAIAEGGIWQGNFGFSSSKFAGQAVLQFLSKYGDVELLNQPHITVRNGGFAIMHAGDQLSYVAETEVVRENEGETVAVSATVKQLKVGVSLAVSPKLLDDKRILLNIWPVVSSVQGYDEFDSDPVPVRVPRLALQELSTEVIVESGKSIQLGGLIRKSVSSSLQTLPFRDGITGALLKPLFHADTKNLERRELVLMVTPKLVQNGQ
ncbi:MAG TPA: hypothetical protein DHW71_11005 [Gammaproteobacteria bacterium]|nr:hypothetical protein [Gammaproteobacteria bacterium]HBF06918.1 hypothetical protein [Gammaproteobacteria bacterium]HCK93511.1 hypothetical protein [Gammaproteobacteria bacterium]|tara:strand:- start:7319 stop:8797 length:1479 start_codon:yes stop_codon:yes gene_type:complete